MFQLKYKFGLICFCLCVLYFSCKTKSKTGFIRLISNETGIAFENKVIEKNGLSILYYLYFYSGGGVATGDVNNDGLIDVYFTANSKGGNKLFLNKGDFKFTDITNTAGVAGKSDWCSGVTMADINADGWLDIYVCAVTKISGLNGRNELFINNKNGTFTEDAAKFGLDIASYSCQSAFFDYDHDGDLDCYLLNQSDRPFQNIVDTSNRHKYDSLSGDRLLRNEMNKGENKFVDVSIEAGIYQSSLGYGLGLAIGDINNDGWDDIYVGNDFHENDYYYINNKNGSFAESGAKHFRHYSRFSMGNDVGDFNNDGQLDILTADMLPDDEKILKTYGSDENADIYNYKIIKNGFQYQYSKNALQINNGNGSSFSDVSLLSGVAATDWSWSALFADIDNDGNKDIFFTSGVLKRTTDLDYIRFISNAYAKKNVNNTSELDKEALDKMPDGISHNYIYKGDGNIAFKDESRNWGLESDKGYFTGAAYADVNNDGRLDMLVNAINSEARLYKNDSHKKNYLMTLFKGDGYNTMGVGTKVWLFTGNKIQYQQSTTTRGFLSSSDNRLHFGLDTISTIDSMLVVWPNQKYQIIKKPKVNQILEIKESEANGSFNYLSFFPEQETILTQVDIKDQDWTHRENAIFDFNVQYLIPQAKSTLGPKIAVADVNGDNREDFYVCGAKGQAGALMLQEADGSFRHSQVELFKKDSNAEETDAIFFDANGDNYWDLYVVTGGNEYSGQTGELLDRIYLNDGKGAFQKSMNSIPEIYKNKSCVSVADVDNDGDNDLFIGTHVDADAYGIPQSSYLLLNDGAAHFSIAKANQIDLRNIGMVTCSAFADINGDKKVDLVIGGEWMPITIFINNGNHFTKSTVQNSTGWWQSLYIDDVNADGTLDFLGGNWGLNNKFVSGKDGPVKLYVSDFDGNGKVDQLMSYLYKGVEYPFLAKDEVERQLPLLKKHYLKYSEYAGVQMKDVFYGWVDTIKPLIAEHLASSIFYGKGDGTFNIDDLPLSLQKAPIFCFENILIGTNIKTYISGGNFYDVIPYEGRYDAQPLALFTVNNTKQVNYIKQPNLSGLDNQVRSVKWVKTAQSEKILVVASNNSSLKFFKMKVGL